MKNPLKYLCIMLLLAPGITRAADEVTADIVELSGGIGYYNFDPARRLEDKPMATIGLGLHFSRRWAALLHYSALNTILDPGGEDRSVQVQKYQIDVHRFFNTENRLRPYVVAGFGQMDVLYDGYKRNENRYNGGIGIAYTMTPSWSVRADVRAYLDSKSNYNENAVMVILGYRFYGGEKAR